MSTSRTTDMGAYVLFEQGEPTVDNPTAWYSAEQQWKTNTRPANRAALTTKATQALAANVTFLAIASPTTAQVTTQVKALTRQLDALIKLMLDQTDDTTGT